MQECGTVTTSSDGGFSFTVRPDPYDALIQPGCSGACIYIPDTAYKELVSRICVRIGDVADTEIRMQVRGFCSALSAELVGFQPGIAIEPMFVDVRDDETYLEWMFDNFRFGFSFRHDIADSYWFLVAKDPREGSRRFRGDFKAGFIQPVRYALDYIRCNA